MEPGIVEVSAGAVLVQRVDGFAQALLIRVRKSEYEVSKGHVEPGETPEMAALRELREETGVTSDVRIGLEYAFEKADTLITKKVHYFAAIAAEVPAQFSKLPKGVRERKWVANADLSTLPLVSEELRAIIARALAVYTLQ